MNKAMDDIMCACITNYECIGISTVD